MGELKRLDLTRMNPALAELCKKIVGPYKGLLLQVVDPDATQFEFFFNGESLGVFTNTEFYNMKTDSKLDRILESFWNFKHDDKKESDYFLRDASHIKSYFASCGNNDICVAKSAIFHPYLTSLDFKNREWPMLKLRKEVFREEIESTSHPKWEKDIRDHFMNPNLSQNEITKDATSYIRFLKEHVSLGAVKGNESDDPKSIEFIDTILNKDLNPHERDILMGMFENPEKGIFDNRPDEYLDLELEDLQNRAKVYFWFMFKKSGGFWNKKDIEQARLEAVCPIGANEFASFTVGNTLDDKKDDKRKLEVTFRKTDVSYGDLSHLNIIDTGRNIKEIENHLGLLNSKRKFSLGKEVYRTTDLDAKMVPYFEDNKGCVNYIACTFTIVASRGYNYDEKLFQIESKKSFSYRRFDLADHESIGFSKSSVYYINDLDSYFAEDETMFLTHASHYGDDQREVLLDKVKLINSKGNLNMKEGIYELCKTLDVHRYNLRVRIEKLSKVTRWGSIVPIGMYKNAIAE